MRKEELLDTVKRSFDGDAWHGPSVKEVLDGVDEEAAKRKLPGVHSIWELALHIAGWTGEVALRLEGKAPSEPPAIRLATVCNDEASPLRCACRWATRCTA